MKGVRQVRNLDEVSEDEPVEDLLEEVPEQSPEGFGGEHLIEGGDGDDFDEVVVGGEDVVYTDDSGLEMPETEMSDAGLSEEDFADDEMVGEDDEQTYGGYSEEEIMAARDEMEQITHGVVQVEEAAAEGVDYWLHLARLQLESHRLFGAKRSVRNAQKELQELGASVLDLRRSLALMQKLISAKPGTTDEIELVLRRLRNAAGAAEMGHVALAAEQVESLIGDLAGGDMSTLNPFLFRSFWVGIETRWPAGGDTGVLMLRILNDGDRDLPAMRLAAPAPQYWRAEPESVDLPTLPPGAYIHLKFNIIPASGYGMDVAPLSRKLSIISGYAVRQGKIRCTVRLQNRSMEPLGNIIVMPWMPPSFIAPTVPLIQRLAPDEVTNIHIPMAIEYTAPGGDA
jgi:hypothetical protein